MQATPNEIALERLLHGMRTLREQIRVIDKALGLNPRDTSDGTEWLKVFRNNLKEALDNTEALMKSQSPLRGGIVTIMSMSLEDYPEVPIENTPATPEELAHEEAMVQAGVWMPLEELISEQPL
jgi:hypothetical protein